MIDFIKVVRASTGVAYKVPIKDTIEKGVREEDLDRYPLWPVATEDIEYVAFDLHLGYGWTNEQKERIAEFQRISQGHPRLFPHDTLELTWLTPRQAAENPDIKWFYKSLGPRDKIKPGNHDPLEKYLAIFGDAFSLFLVKELIYGDIILMGGHEFDNLADTAWKRFYYRFAPWVRDVWLNSPWEQKLREDRRWQPHNWAIWGKAVDWLEESAYKTLGIGHAHDSVIVRRTELGKVLKAIGSLAEDGVYGLIHDGRLEVKKL